MQPGQKSLLCFGMLVLLAGPSLATAAPEDAQAVVDQVLDLSGTTDMVNAFPALIDQQLAAQTGLEGKDGAFFGEVINAAFDPRQLRGAISATLVANYNEAYARATIEWYQSAFGRKIRESEATAQSPEAQEQLKAFAEAFQTVPPAPERVEFVQRLDAASRSTELSLQMLAALMRGMLSGLSAMGAEGTPSPADVDAMIDSQISQLAPMIQAQSLLMLLFVTRNLTDAETSSYLSYVESDAARWFHENMGAAFITAMSRGGSAMATHMAAFMEDRKRSLSKQEAAQQRQAAISEGRAFGKTRKQTGCATEAFQRRNQCVDLDCALQAEIFLEACLETSEKEASLCAGAPPEGDLMATVYWRLTRCEERGATTSACNRLMGKIQKYCAAPRVDL